MTKNLKINLKDFSGNSLRDSGTKEEITLDSVCINSLLANLPDEINLSGIDKVKRYKLAQKIHSKPEEVELASEDITLLKTLIAKCYATQITGQAWELLEE